MNKIKSMITRSAAWLIIYGQRFSYNSQKSDKEIFYLKAKKSLDDVKIYKIEEALTFIVLIKLIFIIRFMFFPLNICCWKAVTRS